MKQIVQLLRFTIFKKFTFQILLFFKKIKNKIKTEEKKKVKQFCLFSSILCIVGFIEYTGILWLTNFGNKLWEQIEAN